MYASLTSHMPTACPSHLIKTCKRRTKNILITHFSSEYKLLLLP